MIQDYYKYYVACSFCKPRSAFKQTVHISNSTYVTICVRPSGRMTLYSPSTTAPSEDSLCPKLVSPKGSITS